MNQATSCDSSLTRIACPAWATSRKRTSWCSWASSISRPGGVVAGRDLVHVEVERHQHAVDRHEVEAGHARFFAGLAERDFFDLPLAVGVAAELQPAVELAMVRQQAAAAIGRENPGRAGDVPRPAGALEAIGVALDERADAVDDVRLAPERRAR